MEGYENFGAPAPPLFMLAVRLSNDILLGQVENHFCEIYFRFCLPKAIEMY